MKKKLIGSIAAGTLVAVAGPAQADSYIKGIVGLNIVDDQDLGSISGTYSSSSYVLVGSAGLQIDADNGFVIGAALGWELEGGFSIEGELAYRDNDGALEVWLDGSISGPSFSTSGSITIDLLEGEAKVFSVMANAWYEFETEGKWKPFVGGGLGWAEVEIVSSIGDTKDSGMAYQVGAGVNYELSARTDLVIEYRYFSMVDDEFNVFGVEVDYDYQAHSTMVGMKVNF